MESCRSEITQSRCGLITSAFEYWLRGGEEYWLKGIFGIMKIIIVGVTKLKEN
jgi:hypothetical protein